jgi:hypothetical protein
MERQRQWRVEFYRGIEVWVQDVAPLSALQERFSLAVWLEGDEGEWEWELIRAATDRHVAGDVAATRHSAMKAAECAAIALGLV